MGQMWRGRRAEPLSKMTGYQRPRREDLFIRRMTKYKHQESAKPHSEGLEQVSSELSTENQKLANWLKAGGLMLKTWRNLGRICQVAGHLEVNDGRLRCAVGAGML